MPIAYQAITDRSESGSVMPFAFRQGLAMGKISKRAFERELETEDKQDLHRRQLWERDIELQPATTLPTSDTSPDAINHNEFVQVVTTTIFTGPTVAVAPTPHSAPVPIGAIAGGAAGGVVLAVIVVLIWMFWGRKIDKDETKKRKKLASIRNAIAYRRHFTSRSSHDSRPVPSFAHSRNSSWSSANPESRKVSFSTPAELQTREKKDSVGSTAGSTLASKISTASTPSTAVSTSEENDPKKPSSILVPSSPKPLKPAPATEIKPANKPSVGRATTSENRYAPFRPSPLASRSPLSGRKSPASTTPTTSPISQNGSVPVGNSNSKSVAITPAKANHQSKPSDGFSVSSASVYSTQSSEKEEVKPNDRPVVWPKRSTSTSAKERPAAFSFSSNGSATSATVKKGPGVTHKSTALPTVSTKTSSTSSASKSSPKSPLPAGAATPHLTPPPVPLPRTLPTTSTSPNDPTRLSTFTYSSGSGYSAVSEETTSTSRWSWLLKSPAVSTIHPPLPNYSTGSLSTAPSSSAAAAVIANRNARSLVIDEFVDEEEEEKEVHTGIAL